MSSIKSFKPVRLELGYSRTLLYYGLIVHALAGIAIISLFSEYPVSILVLPFIAVHFNHYYQLHVTCSAKDAVLALQWSGIPRWQLGLRDGMQVKEQLCEPVFVTSFLIILAFKRQDQIFRRVVLLTRDRVNSDAYHCLQVRLITSGANVLSGNM